MFRRRRLLLFSLIALAGIIPAAPAAAKTVPGSPPFRVIILDHMAGWQLRQFARHGAVGLLVPGTGPTTNRRQALAQLVRGVREDSYLGGVPDGPALLSATAATGTPSRARTIIVTLPPKSETPVANDKRYYVVVLGGGFHGLLVSKTTRIPGLVSIVDIAPTALGHQRGALRSVEVPHAIATLKTLNAQIHANNRLKLAALIVIACFALFLAVVLPRAALTVVPAALLTSIGLGAAGVTNEVAIMAILVIAGVGGGLALARACRTDGRLLSLCLGILAVHVYLLTTRPAWIALTPFGPTQNSRFWGLGNQLSTLLLAPMIVAAAVAARRFGAVGFLAVSGFSIVLMIDNRLGANGGGTVVLVLSLAFLGARMLRLGVRGFVTFFLAAVTFMVWLIDRNLQAPGPNHLRSAFNGGLGGLWAVARNRLPLSYMPAIHNWTVVLPLAIWFVAAFAVAVYVARRRATRDLVLTLGLATLTSLLVNDSAMYVLTGGVAVLGALVRFVPAPAVPVTVRSLVRAVLPAQTVPAAVEAADD
ncbi:MAG TPA: hypothetical protein VGH92_03930 [Gaiellaceae bacterium]